MPRMRSLVRPAREEGALLASPGRDIAVTAVVVVLTAGVFVAVGDHGTQMSIKRWDDTWLRLMISGRTAPLTAVARILNVLGLVYITLPVRIALAGLLALQRKWWHLAAFTAAVAVSEVLIGVLKGTYDRARPPGSLVATTGASFPSGHAVATSVTAVAAVIALVPPGRRRAWWGAAAVTFSVLMGLSRAYLAAHWLSDAVAGVLLGTSCALTAALVVGLVQRWWQGRRQPVGAHRMASVLPPDQVAVRRRTA
jgi:membrane-associated phospholipid phosphatase